MIFKRCFYDVFTPILNKIDHLNRKCSSLSLVSNINQLGFKWLGKCCSMSGSFFSMNTKIDGARLRHTGFT